MQKNKLQEKNLDYLFSYEYPQLLQYYEIAKHGYSCIHVPRNFSWSTNKYIGRIQNMEIDY